MRILFVVLLLATPAHAADAVPFFKSSRLQIPVDPHQHVVYGPKLPDPIAPECAVDDKVCLDAHDFRAFNLALMTRDANWCDQAADPAACKSVYAFVVGEAPWEK